MTPDDQGGWHVAKIELVSVLQALLGSRRLIMATPAPPLGKVLEGELRLFTAKITPAGNEQFTSWRERDHDDLCLACALAAFLGERTACGWDGTVHHDAGRGSLMAQLPDGVFASNQQGPANDSRYFGGRAPARGGISWRENRW